MLVLLVAFEFIWLTPGRLLAGSDPDAVAVANRLIEESDVDHNQQIDFKEFMVGGEYLVPLLALLHSSRSALLNLEVDRIDRCRSSRSKSASQPVRGAWGTGEPGSCEGVQSAGHGQPDHSTPRLSSVTCQKWSHGVCWTGAHPRALC